MDATSRTERCNEAVLVGGSSMGVDQWNKNIHFKCVTTKLLPTFFGDSQIVTMGDNLCLQLGYKTMGVVNYLWALIYGYKTLSCDFSLVVLVGSDFS